MKTNYRLTTACLCLFASVLCPPAFAQGTAFTYQGRLNDSGVMANGTYDLAFTLYATNAGGSALAGPVTNAAVAVSNGLFTTLVDFGNAFTGTSNWLELAVSTNGANAFATLVPRQQLTPVPYALLAANVSGPISASALHSVTVTNNATGLTLGGGFSGDGGGLTNLNATALGGGLTVSHSPAALVNSMQISSGFNYAVAVSGDYCYIGDDTSGGCLVYRVSNPLAPALVTNISSGACRGVVVSGNAAFLATTVGLKIYDVSNPGNPSILGGINNGSAYDLTLVGNYCYVADTSDGLRIYDVSNPALPVSVGHINNGGNALGVAVSGNYCYLANGSDGLRIYDVTSPSAPLLVAHVPVAAGGTSWGVSVYGNTCYLANNSDGLRIYDVSNPANPVSLAHLTPYAYHAVVEDNVCYLANGSSGDGLHLYDVHNPAAPVDLGTPGLYSFCIAVAPTSNYVYAVGAYYLQIFGQQAVTAPLFAGSGALLTDLNASQLVSGTVSDNLLSANIPRLNAAAQVFGCSRFAAGQYAQSPQSGSFVWNSFPSANAVLNPNQFSVFGAHGFNVDYYSQTMNGNGARWFYIGDIFAGYTIATWNGASLTDGGVWSNASDKNRKTDFVDVDPQSVLAKLADLPVREWRYTNEVSCVRHLGPTAQDFMAAFHLGLDDKSIGTVDESGVALAAIQGLNEKLEARSKQVEAENTELKERLAALEALVQRLTQALPK